jgi:hypothetical protein
LKKSDLLVMWDAVDAMEAKQDYRAIRFDKACCAEVYVALSVEDQRCLILRSNAMPVKPIEKQKIEIKYDDTIPGIVLKLADSDYQDLFDDLVVSLYGVIRSEPNLLIAQEVFIRQFRKWVALFEIEHKRELSKEIILGLIGELHVLEALLGDVCDSEVDRILSSWRGPYDETQDFVLEDKNLEVKTVTSKATSIQVNSLSQLAEEHGKGLELVVRTVTLCADKGESLSGVFQRLVGQAVLRGGDSTILFEAISQKGLSTQNISDYDYLKYVFKNEKIYDATVCEFPKLTMHNISPSITKASYIISIAGLEPFLVRESEFK